MKRFGFIVSLLTSILFSETMYGQEPTVQVSNLAVTNATPSSITLSWTNGNGENTLILCKEVELTVYAIPDTYSFLADANYGDGDYLTATSGMPPTTTYNYIVYNGNGSSITVTGLMDATKYMFYAVTYNGSGGTEDYLNSYETNYLSHFSSPFQASDITFSSIQADAITASYTSGSGGNRIVLVKAGSPVDADPVDNTQYTANTVFGSGQQLGTGNYVVAKGDNNSVTVTGLTAGITYHFKVYEYISDGTNRDYRTDGFDEVTDNPNSQITLKPEPTTQASDISFTSTGSSEVSLTWTAGNGDGSMVVVRAEGTTEVDPVDFNDYTANTAIGSAGTTGAGNFVVFKGLGTSVTVTGLTPETTYHFKVYEFNNEGALSNYKIDGYPSGTNPNSTTTLKGQPAQASELVFTNITENSMTVSWTTGGGDGAVLIAREASAIADFPIDGTPYSGDLAFGSGANLGNNTFVLYNGIAETADITGLSLGTTYHFMVCEYNNSGTETDYNTNPGTNNPGSQSTLKTFPTTQATAITITDIQANQFTLTWTNGDGDNRVVLMKQGAAVNAIPANGTNYTANTVFGAGNQLGTGNYVVFNGSTNSVTVTGLDANTNYYAKVFEYNNTGTDILFKTDDFSDFNPASAKTLPTLQASELVFSNVQNNSIDLSWTRGNGDSVLVVAKAGTTLTETPTEGTIYTANGTFESGETIAPGVYVVYSGTGTSVSVDGLAASTDYVFKAFEFNNSEPYTSYLNTDGSSNNPATQSTTGDEPTTQASAVSFANTSSTQTDVSWTAGNGDGRIVLAYEGDTLSALPVDGTTYTANAIFGSGSEIGTGNFVVALGDVISETVTGLTPESEYQFRVFEYSGSGSSINYLTSAGSDNPDSVTTLVGKPIIQASNVTYDQLDTESYRVNWTHGSGDSLLVVAVAGTFTTSENPVDETDYVADAAFGSGTLIGSGRVVYKGISADGSVIVTNLTAATNYSFKVFEYNSIGGIPYYQTADGTDNPTSRSTLETEPTTQAGTINFSSVGATQLTLDWSPRGNGTNVIVIARESADILTHPVDGTSYSGNNDFTLAEVYATDHRVVFNGSGTGATITNLNPNATYYFRAYEYNGSASTCNYLTSSGGSSNTTTIKAEPTLQAGNFSFSVINTTSFTVNWNRGNGDNVFIVASTTPINQVPADGIDTCTVSSVFGQGSEIALESGIFAVYKGTASAVDISGLTSATQYYFRAFEYNNTGTDIDYLTTPDNSASQFTLSTEPTVQVSAFGNTVYNDTISLDWINGNGTGRIILAKHGNAVDASPTDGVEYTASAIFGSGTELGTGNYVVYAGNLPDTVRITGLLASETYYFQAFEYDNTGALNYLLTDAPTTSATTGTKGVPSVQASEINFTNLASDNFTINWINGNGENRLVVMREGEQGTISTPVDNTNYVASNDWTTKGTELESSGYYTVYNGSGSSVSVSNLTPNTTYWVYVFEYNNPAGFESYNTNTETNNPANGTTLKTIPTGQSWGISSGTITSNSINISWTRGNGDNCIAVINTSNSFSAYDGFDPLANANYIGSGEQVIYNGTGSSVTVSGLDGSSTYWFKVMEYNNSETYTLYHSADTTDNPISFATLGTATWVGTTTDWTTNTNWSPTAVPTSLQSVIISSGQSAYPELSSSHSVDNMVIEAGATITIADGGHLNITRDLLLESPTSSGSSGALVIPGSGTISVGGTSTMERYNPNPLSRRFLSFPTPPSISTFNNYYVFGWEEPNINWIDMNGGPSIATMQGLLVWDGPQMITFTGAFNNGNQSINVTNSSPGDGSYGWNLVGNPYPSTIDWDAASGWTLNNVDATAYYYNGSTYDTWNSGSHSGTGGGTQYIAAGQGFFVHASANGSLGMTNEVRVTNTQNLLKTAETEKQLIRIETANNNLTSDALLLFYSDATDDFDAQYDAYKLTGDLPELAEVYFINKTDQLAINTFAANKLAELNETPQLVFPLGLLNQTSGIVNFRISEKRNIPSDINIYVYDALTNGYTNLNEVDYELFIAGETNYIEDRFELVLSKNALSINNENLDVKIWSFASEKTIFIKSSQAIETSSRVYLYDLTGRLLNTNTWNGLGLQEFKVEAAGTYIIKIQVEKNIITQKVVVQ